MSFATLQQRVNTTALKRLGAGGAITLGGVGVAGDFLAPYAQADVGQFGMATSAPVLVVADLDAIGVLVGTTPVVADGVAYVVATPPESDGFGFTRLVLELAA